MGLFGKVFGSNEKKDQRTALTHPDQLRKADIIKFAFLPQQEISNQQFEVIAVNTYDFENEKSYSLTLKGEKNNRLWLSVTRDDGEEYLSISKKLSRSDVQQLFDADQFASVFDEGAGTKLERKGAQGELMEWTSSAYTEEEDCAQGYYHEGDYRDHSLPQHEDESTPVDYYLLSGNEGRFAIEIEVYTDGDTEVLATVHQELTAIDDMWPAREV